MVVLSPALLASFRERRMPCLRGEARPNHRGCRLRWMEVNVLKGPSIVVSLTRRLLAASVAGFGQPRVDPGCIKRRNRPCVIRLHLSAPLSLPFRWLAHNPDGGTQMAGSESSAVRRERSLLLAPKRLRWFRPIAC